MIVPLLLSLTVLYGAACGLYGTTPHAPLILRWPLPIWNRIAHDWRRPRPRPDYARIARLERELGIGDDIPTA
ncbi:hypothetical protein [Streptomyces sp. NRRL S-1022]|uniref:hypothetical protein n=1 Tax=Streptomyces sp. NRRL S-1022 TaxID=1463880 RepID=UPI0004BF6D80|nr:hypothetical protein [Streptomyces sp. NRRL S-1022]